MFFWVVLIPSVFVATKAVYLFLILLFLFHVLKRVPLKKVLLFVVTTALAGYFLFTTTINKIFINSWQVFMYRYERVGLLGALLSGRDTFITRKLEPLVFDIWSFPNFIFGGQDVVSHYIEMGFFDLFLFFGLFGFTLYLFMFKKMISLLSFPKDFNFFVFVSLFIIIATAGHFFESGIAGIHFIFIILINRKIKTSV